MTAWPMRNYWPSIVRARFLQPKALPRGIVASIPQTQRHLANIREPDFGFTEVALWFNSSLPRPLPPDGAVKDVQPPDERTLKLGKTVRILHERLPTLLHSPLPHEILSPQITLNLFPSTHPHLPSVSGKLAYNAALWTAPVAWGRLPVVGNVKLVILSERMVRNGHSSSPSPSSHSSGSEKLIVKWKTCGKTKGYSDKITEFLGRDADDDEEFTGLFIFEFDEEGRILSHTIEHVEEGGNWEKMTKVISVTDWLLGKAWGKREEMPALAMSRCEVGRRRVGRHPKYD